MMTSKEALKALYIGFGKAYSSSEIYEAKYVIENALEVLEIIKNKFVFPLALMSLPYELYNNSVIKEMQLTQEEYDMIKEYFKNEN